MSEHTGMPLSDPKQPMHTWEPLSRFSSRADDYAKYRPRYPAEALAAVLEWLGDPSKLVAADVGAGTGISSRWLADAGVNVIAIEPNEAMRAAAEPHPRIKWWAGTGETTGLALRSVDLILCAQAFHWFKAEAALAHFAQVLKPRGRLALMWNDRVDRDEETRGYNSILSSFGADVRYEQSKKAGEELRESDLFTGFREQIFTNHQEMDLEATIGRTRSISTCPPEGPVWDAIRARLEAWFNQHQRSGKTRLVYDCMVYTATVK